MKTVKRSPRRPDKAAATFKQGFNCAQAVLLSFCPELGLSPRAASRVSQAFGAGMARRAETCGAVTGAFMVLGLKHGKTRAKDEPAKERTYALVHRFAKEFRRRHGALTCKALLGHNIGTPRGLKMIKEKKLHDTVCPRLVRDAVRILDTIL